MNLAEWVKEVGGPERAAKKAGVTPCTIRCWLRRATTPTHKAVVRIVKSANGKITAGEIYSYRLDESIDSGIRKYSERKNFGPRFK